MKKHVAPILAVLLVVSIGANLYLLNQTSNLNTRLADLESNIAIVNDEVISLKGELVVATAGRIEAQVTINGLEEQLKEIEDQAAFEAEFGEELTYIANDTSMTVEDRKSLINEMGAMFSCNVDKYIEMINTGGTGSGTGDGGTTTPPPATTPPATTPPATTPPAPTPKPPVTPNPPKTTPTPGAGTGGNTGGTDTKGKTDDEIDDAYAGWDFAGGKGGSTNHPDDKLS